CAKPGAIAGRSLGLSRRDRYSHGRYACAPAAGQAWAGGRVHRNGSRLRVSDYRRGQAVTRMAWLLFAIALVILALLCWRHWRFVRHYDHLEKLIGEIAEGRVPTRFIFFEAPRFTRMAVQLEKISVDQQR